VQSYAPVKNPLKSACSSHDIAENTVPVFWHITKKSGRIKPPNGQKMGKNFKVFYGLDTMHCRAFFPLTLRFTMEKIKLAENAEISPPGDRMSFVSILS
jgi:hypothetical protein